MYVCGWSLTVAPWAVTGAIHTFPPFGEERVQTPGLLNQNGRGASMSILVLRMISYNSLQMVCVYGTLSHRYMARG